MSWISVPEAGKDLGSGYGTGKGIVGHLGNLSGLASWMSQTVLDTDHKPSASAELGLVHFSEDLYLRGKWEVSLLPTMFRVPPV